VSTPAWRAFQQHRFAAYDRLTRSQANLVRSLLGPSQGLKGWVEACNKGDMASCELIKTESTRANENFAKQLVRIASSYAEDLAGPLPENARIALRIRIVEAVPWSERGKGKPKSQDVDIGIFPVVHGVAQSGLYRRASAGVTLGPTAPQAR
jgi:hypothetical protein